MNEKNTFLQQNIPVIKIVLAAIVIALVSFVFVIQGNQVAAWAQNGATQYFTQSICDEPIRYKIGYIDPRFGLATQDAVVRSEEAVIIWNTAYGKDLFLFDSIDPDITIQFVYDRRTSLHRQINSLENQVNEKDQSLEAQISDYHQQVADFKKKLADFSAQAESLNQQITYWNERGGAPPDEYEKLRKQQDDLRAQQQSLEVEAERLNQVASQLNLSTQNYNQSVGELNTSISQFNSALGQKPEEGVYDPATKIIDIYFVDNQPELVHTLAHELGHALGLYHNQDEQSIMYPSSTQTTRLSPADGTALVALCSRRSIKLPFAKEIRNAFNKIDYFTATP